jgi:hypothetical protein
MARFGAEKVDMTKALENIQKLVGSATKDSK